MKHPNSKHSFFASCPWVALIIATTIFFPVTAIGNGRAPDLTRDEQQVVHEAQRAMAAKNYAQARKKLSEYIEKTQGKIHYLVNFTLGNAWILDNKPEKALPFYLAAADGHSSDAAVWQNLGKAYHDLGRLREAGDSLAKAYALAVPHAPVIAYQAASAYIEARRPADALPLLERIVKRSATPQSEWLEALLKVYMDVGKKRKALDLTRKIVSSKGDSARMWQLLTHLYIDRKDYAKAAAAMEIQLSLFTASPEQIEQLGDLYQMAGVPLKAARQYEKLLARALHPQKVEKTASAYLDARKADAAIDVLKKGIAHRATPFMWWLLASAYYDLEKFDEAMEAFERCICSDPKNGEAHLMMGYCALRLERFAKAQSAFTQAAGFAKQREEANQRLNELERYHLSSTSSPEPPRDS